MLVKTAATSYVGDHLFCRISRHNSPVPYTLGWNISLINFTPGGLFGYASSKCITRRKVPSSKGVSAGPIMTAFLLHVSTAMLRRYTLACHPFQALQIQAATEVGVVSRAEGL
jgi:hypothetical protein